MDAKWSLKRRADSVRNPEIVDVSDLCWIKTLDPRSVAQGDTLDELRAMVKDAVHCHFGNDLPGPMPKIIRLHFVRDEVMAA